MFELDGSETSWLVYCDWLGDQDISSDWLREIIEDKTSTNDWSSEIMTVPDESSGVGSLEQIWQQGVGADDLVFNFPNRVGAGYFGVQGFSVSFVDCVGSV